MKIFSLLILASFLILGCGWSTSNTGTGGNGGGSGGTGGGKTAGRGHKGKGSRSGGNTPPGYEGGQMPLKRRVPKRGFRRLQKAEDRREEFVVVNLKRLAALGVETVDPLMAARGIIRAADKVKGARRRHAGGPDDDPRTCVFVECEKAEDRGGRRNGGVNRGQPEA